MMDPLHAVLQRTFETVEVIAMAGGVAMLNVNVEGGQLLASETLNV